MDNSQNGGVFPAYALKIGHIAPFYCQQKSKVFVFVKKQTVALPKPIFTRPALFFLLYKCYN
jgi:hypothetical protein